MPYEPTQTSICFRDIWIHVLVSAAMDNGPHVALVDCNFKPIAHTDSSSVLLYFE